MDQRLRVRVAARGGCWSIVVGINDPYAVCGVGYEESIMVTLSCAYPKAIGMAPKTRRANAQQPTNVGRVNNAKPVTGLR